MSNIILLCSFLTLREYVSCFVYPLQTGRTALMVASHDGHDKVVNELLQANADVNLCDKVCLCILYRSSTLTLCSSLCNSKI